MPGLRPGNRAAAVGAGTTGALPPLPPKRGAALVARLLI